MEKSYLYKRINVYWVRVRVPDKVRDIVGKAQFSRNLSTMEKSYLYKRHNVYWVRVPDKVRDIVGKAQFSRNLSITDLSEANRKKHIVIAELVLPMKQF